MNSTDEQSTPTWSQVWAQRFVGPSDSAPALEELIRIDGFDVGAGAITVASWREYSASIATTLGLRRDDLVFEIGCGAGALLLALQEDAGVRVCGMDLSGPLIATAQRALPSGQFFVADATAPPPPEVEAVVATSKAVVSNSVVHYFPALEDVNRMVGWLAGLVPQIALLEVPDAATMSASEQERAAALPPGEYARRYEESGLRHLYIHRDEMHDIARVHGLSVETVQQEIRGYRQSRFRFNAFFRH